MSRWKRASTFAALTVAGIGLIANGDHIFDQNKDETYEKVVALSNAQGELQDKYFELAREAQAYEFVIGGNLDRQEAVLDSMSWLAPAVAVYDERTRAAAEELNPVFQEQRKRGNTRSNCGLVLTALGIFGLMYNTTGPGREKK